MSDTSKSIVRRYIDEVVNGGNLDLIDELVAPGIEVHPGTTRTTAQLKEALGRALHTFSNPTVEIDDLIAEGDRVAARLTLRGTYDGKLVEFLELQIYRVEDNRVAELWFAYDWPPGGKE
jgi:predicted ester cyclase